MSFHLSKKLPDKESITLWTSLMYMLQSGLTNRECLNVIISNPSNKVRKSLLESMYRGFDEGKQFYEVVRDNEKVLGFGLWQQIAVAEQSGTLPDAVGRIAEQFRSGGETASKIKSALIYPAVIFIFAIVIFLYMMISVLPTMEESLADVGGQLPDYSKVCMEFANWFVTNWYISMGGLALIIYGIVWVLNNPLRMQFHRLIFYFPISSLVSIDTNFNRLYTLLVDMLRNGSTPLESLRVSASAVSNLYVSTDLLRCADAMDYEGLSLAEALQGSKTMPADDRMLLDISLRSGRVNEMLEDLQTKRAKEAKLTVDGLTESVSVISTLLIGVVVAVIVMLVYMPMMELTTSIG